MPKESLQATLERVMPLLTEEEVNAYNFYKEEQLAPVGIELNAKLYALFLRGKDCKLIQVLNRGLHLGQIVSARIEGQWDRRKDEYLDKTLDEIGNRIQQTSLETANLICDLLNVASREYSERLAKYIQTGSKDDLGDFRIKSLTELAKTIELLQKMTGTRPTRHVEDSYSPDVQEPIEMEGKMVNPTSPEEARSAIKDLLR